MKLICKKNTKKLVKGAIYEALKIDTIKPSNARYFRPWVIVKINDNQVGFRPENFTLTNGEDIPEMNWQNPSFQDAFLETNYLQGDKIKVGDFVVYKNSRCKTLEPGKIYKISEIKSTERGTLNHKWTEYKVKVEGSNTNFGTYNFRPCSTQEVRDIALKKLFDEKVDVAKAGEAPRIIDRYSDKYKEQVLLGLIISASLDINRHNMSILDWAVRLGQKQSVTREDFTPILSKTISSIIEETPTK
jgi:hypothetical protein